MTNNHKPFLPHGGYRKLRSYKVAEVVYDATVVFCQRFFRKNVRMTDQMVQAARSGARNISEASGAAATSRKSELKLTNVARASLSDELLPDYKSFLTQRGLRVWPKDSKEARAMRDRLSEDKAKHLPPSASGTVQLTGLDGLSDFVAKADPEIAGNAMVCAVNQSAYLLKCQLEKQGEAFLESGGFSENLYRQRSQKRGQLEPALARNESEQPPECPLCGSPMRKRTARKGARAGSEFWGCSAYPECKATLPVKKSNGMSDESDKSDEEK